jgi:hypothetical protein
MPLAILVILTVANAILDNNSPLYVVGHLMWLVLVFVTTGGTQLWNEVCLCIWGEGIL